MPRSWRTPPRAAITRDPARRACAPCVLAACAAVLLAGAACLRAQDATAPAHGTTFEELLLPRAWVLPQRLRAAVGAMDSIGPHTKSGDLARLDAIWEQAVYLADGDAQDALLAAAVATLPYRRFPAHVPLVGVEVIVPVSSESGVEFRRRLARLPGVLFADTPPEMDRDKLPHFFGAAWLQLWMHQPEAVLAAGGALEVLESGFRLEGAMDERDMRANRLGARFGRLLLRGRAVPPSHLFLRSDSLRAIHGHDY